MLQFKGIFLIIFLNLNLNINDALRLSNANDIRSGNQFELYIIFAILYNHKNNYK